jgi:hypothetical protein
MYLAMIILLMGVFPALLFYGLAGMKHLIKGYRNRTENIAIFSDLWIFLVLAGFLGGRF